LGNKFACTDVGNAKRLAALHAHDLRYCPERKSFFVWDGSRWKLDTEALAAQAFAKELERDIARDAKHCTDDAQKKKLWSWASKTQMGGHLTQAIRLCRDELTISAVDFDKNPMLLNCTNGVVDLKTGRLRPHEPGAYLSKTTGVRFVKGAKAPRWLRFLEEVIPSKAVRRFVHKYAGYCATGSTKERKFAMLQGEGRNGKSVFLYILSRVLGEYACTAPPTLLMMSKHGDPHPAEVAFLQGQRLAVASEVAKGSTFDEAKLKRLTGGTDSMSARLMGENWINFEPSHKLILASNPFPNVRDMTDSFWDRFCLVVFGVRIEKEDPDLPAKLLKELSGILNWIIEGALLWQKEGLGRPPEVTEATDEYRRSEDRLGQFFTERCELGPQHHTAYSS
jgi:putative DNA primase/helicase